ncbi:FecR family protein [Sphingobacterium sp. xlx-130]|uniref:FecR family protein n=1 Tax=Sphingobacterium sp. xlx-130 TaxID=2654323 RepID=UPI0013DD0EB5|nr:FecR domain-containing protein [Sphingobacterium sp. xlx-130]
MQKINRWKSLLLKLITEGNNSTIRNKLEDFYGSYPKLRELEEEVLSKSSDQDFEKYIQFQKEASISKVRIKRRLSLAIANYKNVRSYRVRKYIALAASLFLCITTSIYLYFYSSYFESLQSRELYVSEAANIKPITGEAILHIDGEGSFTLKQGSEGVTMTDSTVNFDGQQIYAKPSDMSHRELVIETPKGTICKIKLSDGTIVHLNASSKITYPAKFANNERKVRIDGEAIFEVAKDVNKPFFVHTQVSTVKVLGTQFNVRSYSNESCHMVTLLEGSVRIYERGEKDVFLIPGSQWFMSDSVSGIKPVNVEDIFAWKEGIFVFDQENLGQFMAKMSNWYDYEIIVSPSAQKMRVWGTVTRYDSFDKILDIIRVLDKDLKIKIKGRRIEITK